MKETKKNDEDIDEILKIVSDLIRKIKSKKKNSFNDKFTELTSIQIYTLYYLYTKSNVTMSEISKYIGVKMPTMTEIIDKLVEKKYVKRSRDEKDRRNVNVSITDKGKKIIDKHITERKKFIKNILKDLDSSERKKLIDVLRRLQDIIK